MNCFVMFLRAWTVIFKTMASDILDDTSYTGVPSMTMMNLEAVMARFQNNLDSVCSIGMIASAFDGIVESTQCRRAFDIVIQDHHIF